MSLDEVLEFCADLGFDAVDPTAYYFPGYPKLPDDSYVYRIKRKAFRLGLDISGTGVRNDFTIADPVRRKAEVELVKRWVGFSAKLGAPVLRVFSGRGVPPEKTRDKVNSWLAEALRECTDYASKFGVMIVIQNHADFIETADHVSACSRMLSQSGLRSILTSEVFGAVIHMPKLPGSRPTLPHGSSKRIFFSTGKK